MSDKTGKHFELCLFLLAGSKISQGEEGTHIQEWLGCTYNASNQWTISDNFLVKKGPGWQIQKKWESYGVKLHKNPGNLKKKKRNILLQFAKFDEFAWKFWPKKQIRGHWV